KWVAGFTGSGFEWFSAVDGHSAGLLPVPRSWVLPPDRTVNIGSSSVPIANLAIRPDGQKAVGFVYGKSRDLLVGVWDLASGRATESFVLPLAQTQGQFNPAALWCGPRRIL